MAYRVFKFGGSSLANSEAIEQVATIISKEPQNLVVVVSAMGGVTDTLIGLAEDAVNGKREEEETRLEWLADRYNDVASTLVRDSQKKALFRHQVDASIEELRKILFGLSVLHELTDKVRAKIVARGERLMAYLLIDVLGKQLGDNVTCCEPVDLIKVSHGPLGMNPDNELCRQAVRSHLKPLLDAGQTVVVPGFYGSDTENTIVTLGRGGSDFSATILASHLPASSVTLYKTVDGLMTADPVLVPTARVIPQLHYREAAELAFYGAKILHPRTIIPLVEENIPLFIKNTLKPELDGSCIHGEVRPGAYPVKALTGIPRQTLVAVEGKGMLGVPGIAARTFKTLGYANISVAMISQASSEASICFVVPGDQAKMAQNKLREEFRFEIDQVLIDDVKLKENVSILAIVGIGMSGIPGIAARAFSSLAKHEINLAAIAQGSSELNISIVVRDEDLALATLVLHGEFCLEKIRSLQFARVGSSELIMFGLGQIGQTLLRQLMDQETYFKRKLNLQLLIHGVSDRSGFKVLNSGCKAELDELMRLKGAGSKLFPDKIVDEKVALSQFQEMFGNKQVGNGIVVDVTAEESYPLLKQAVENGYSIVLANKKPLAVAYPKYIEIFELAKAKGVSIRYEATVGAGLPVLDTLSKLHDAGDEVLSVVGCFSGTLGYLMTCMEDGDSFSAAVEKAYKLGFTEPDPREDLSGKDVARKALILARTLEQQLDMDDIQLEPLFPAHLDHEDPLTFISGLQELDAGLLEKVERARSEDKVLRYVARLDESVVTVGIEMVDKDSPLGRLRGTDNQVNIRTRRYDSNPLIVTGPGAGAQVTAAGVLNDILAISASS